MATENLQIPDILANQNSKEVTANTAHNLLDRAMNNNVSTAVAAGINNLTTTQARENFVIELTGTPGVPFTVEMPDTNKRTMAIVNNSDDTATIQNPSAGGTGQPVIAVGEAAIFHFDGTDFFDFSALALTVAAWLGLTDTPGSYAGESGRYPQVNTAETALEFVGTAAKRNVIAATTGALTLATDIETGDIIDGVTLALNDRVLVKNQAAGQENGIYYVQTAAPPIRAEDFDDALDMNESPVMIPILEGTANAGTVWVHTTTGAITVDTTPLTFVQLLSPGTLLSLTDFPANYTDDEGRNVRVNAAANAVEFVNPRWLDPIRAASTGAGTLSTDFEAGDTLDGVTLVLDDRILIKNQATATENGVYTVETTGAPTRAVDFDDNTDLLLGTMMAVLEGTANANTMWMHDAGEDIGVENNVFVSIGGGVNRFTEAIIQTTDATTTNIDTIALGSGEGIAVRGFIIGRGPTTQAFAANFFAAGQNNGGTSAQLAAASITVLDGSGAGAWTLAIDVDDTTDTIRLRVTGEAATTINWTVQYEIITET